MTTNLDLGAIEARDQRARSANILGSLNPCAQDRRDLLAEVRRLQGYVDRMQQDLNQRVEQAESERDDLRALFDLQQTRMHEATAAWQAEAPQERESLLPDLGDLLAWLLQRGDTAEAVVARVRELLAEWQQLGRGDGVHGQQLRDALDGLTPIEALRRTLGGEVPDGEV